MKFIIPVIFALLLLSPVLYGQTGIIKGSVGDSASVNKLANATVCVLRAKDSSLYKFARVNADGLFAVSGLHRGKYILMVTYPQYADYIERFALDSLKDHIDFGKIDMKLKSRVLAEVMIKAAKDAVKIKGDTTEYYASGFVIQPNSKVEDLLKQLPGIQIDKDGKITAQGKTVNKVLVDGEEFFGDDPTLVTKNIRGDMVDKVQVYDKKSDQATFTGIDDGVKNKTINIQLKEDKKNGYFGKGEAGAGADKYYQGQAMFNTFKAKQKLSVYGIVANTGKTGLGWQDSGKYGSASDDMEFSDDGGIYFTSGRDDLESFDGSYNGQGIPLARTGGVHYDNKWNADKQSINSNYKFGYLEVDGLNNALSQNTLPTAVLSNSSDQSYKKSLFRQKLDGTYQFKIDSLSNIKISLDGTLKHFETNDDYTATSYRGFDTLLNNSKRALTSNGNQQIINGSLFYNKRFKKAGRSFSWNISESYNENKTTGNLNSTINYYNARSGGIDSTQIIDQYKTNHIKENNLKSNITYTEPFSKSFSVILNYGTGFNNSSSNRQSFNKSASGLYDKPDAGLSNNYQFNQLSNQLGAVFNYKKSKSIFNFGTKATAVTFNQINEYTGSTFKRSFINWSPQASYQYKFSQQQALSLRYNGSATQPTIDQIQPVVVNTDPLNINLGNPDLSPSFNNSFSLNYNSYKVLKGQSVYLGGYFSFTSNPIVSNSVTDTTGKTIYRAANINKKPVSFSLYADFSQSIKKIDLNVGLRINASGNTSYNYSNNVLNTTQSYNYSGQIVLSKYKEKKYDMYIVFGPNYTYTKSSLQAGVNNNGLGFNGDSGFNFYLPWKIEIGTDGNYQYTPKTQSFNEGLSKLILNAAVAKKLLKQDNLKLSLSVKDLLNQNIGFNRYVSDNTIGQNSYNSIRRYFLFSITYDFSHMGGSIAKK
ncbi:outer membrane beta-barrel family protein [Mucilaginibacter paludis]|uniref:TonB-dependent receptor n=1 Tax=Mucilaginibacter paludis DSM 18603 TaxID=714943 RepID=H1YDH3_9SPHI|nr:outer membrane beta-barrel family protein [Mucilaginibacter paludis]EHQ30182.1 TonB-dependent receptor [Mucilaginibacter paludis DSM 18603]